jgi:hypothetical protein
MFYITKIGVRFTGMTAWHIGDEDIWRLAVLIPTKFNPIAWSSISGRTLAAPCFPFC